MRKQMTTLEKRSRLVVLVIVIVVASSSIDTNSNTFLSGCD